MENQNDLLKKISSGEAELITEAVKEIKENGDLTIAQALLQNLEHIQDLHTVTIIANLLADIKENSFREILIQQIQATTQLSIKSELLRIVWESSLDYSAYLEIFLKILQEDDFSIAFEASTVIESMIHHLSADQLSQLHKIIESFPADKQFLIENIHAEMDCSGGK